MTNQRNIVLIMADQWRGDCLSSAGHPVVNTPYLDQLALKGARFTNAYSACPSCIAARASLMTGLTPGSHGRVGYQDGVPWNYPTTLAGEFTRNGYQTQAVGKMHVYPERSQIGFQNVILHDGFLHYARSSGQDPSRIDDYLPWLQNQVGYQADYFDHGVNCNSIVSRPWDKAEYLHPTNYVTTQAIDFLRRRDTRKPFLLFVSYHRPHPPYDPPGWAFDQYIHRDMPQPPIGDWEEEVLSAYDQPGNPEAFVDFSIDPVLLQRARAGYYGHMTHIDHQINRLVESLRMFDAHRNTLVMFTADHGEMMGDHHMFRKAYGYEGSANVPLIVADPFGAGVVPGGVYTEAVALRDIFPTLLETAGLPVPESIEGCSFGRIMKAESTDWRDFIHGEHTVLGQSMQWLTDGHIKLIWFSGNGHTQLFDLDNDPEEKQDLSRSPEYHDLLALWRDRLAQTLAGREEGFSRDNTLIPGRPVKPVLLSCP